MAIAPTEIKLMLGALTGVALGNFAIFSSPIYIGGLIDGHGFSSSQAGLTSTMEISAVAITCLSLSNALSGISLRKLGLAGLILLLSTNLISLFQDGFVAILFARIGAGIGAGICLAGASAILSRMKDPDRTVGVLLAATTLIMVLALTVMGHAKALWMFNGFVGVYSVLALTMVPLVFLLPKNPFERTPKQPKTPIPKDTHLPLGVLGLILFFLFCVLEGGVWSFSERQGTLIGMSTGDIGSLLALAQLAGLSGALLAAVLGARLPRIYPISIGIILMGTAGFFIYRTDLTVIYAACLSVFGFAFMFAFPYLLGAFAKLGADGRWAARANGVNLLGGAVAPLIVALVVSVSDFRTLGLSFLSLAIVGLCLAVTFSLGFMRVEFKRAQAEVSIA